MEIQPVVADILFTKATLVYCCVITAIIVVVVFIFLSLFITTFLIDPQILKESD